MRTAAKMLSELHARCHLLYGAPLTTTFMMQTSSVALLGLLSDFEDADSRQIFADLCSLASQQATRWPLTLVLLRMVQWTANDMDVVLGPQCKAIFDYLDSLEQTWQDRYMFNSDFPNIATAQDIGRGYFTVQSAGDMLSRWT